MSHSAHRARIVAMQALCQWDVQQDESPEGLEELLAGQNATPAEAEHAKQLVRGYWLHKQAVDDRIAAAAAHWDLPRMGSVERNVLRVAVVELLEGATPGKVVLDEAIEIGREYGGADSPRFINGVLDLVFKRLERRRKVER